MQITTKRQRFQMVPDHVKEDVMSRLIIYGAGIPTAAMGWLNDNSTGITAACTVAATAVVVWRGYRDWRRDRRARRD